MDFAQEELPLQNEKPLDIHVGDYIMGHLYEWCNKHLEKVIGLALPQQLVDKCPTIPSRLWSELDIIPLILSEDSRLAMGGDEIRSELHKSEDWELRTLDEQAESMARKCVRCVSCIRCTVLTNRA